MTFDSLIGKSIELLGDEEGQDIISVITDSDFEDNEKQTYPENLPILPLKNTVMYPGVVFPVTVGRDKSIQLIKDAHAGKKIVGVVAQKDQEVEDPKAADLYTTGTVAVILRMFKMPDGNTTVIIQGKRKFEIKEIVKEDPYFQAVVDYKLDDKADTSSETAALMDSIREIASKIVEVSPKYSNGS